MEKGWNDEHIREGSVADVGVVLSLLDAAVEWLVSEGRTAQWGDQPWSTRPGSADRFRGAIEDGELLLLRRDGRDVAALIASPLPPHYVAPNIESESYVHVLVSEPSPAGSGAGRRLLDESWRRTLARGIRLQRVDCFAGGDGALVAYYERAGFRRSETFDYHGWPGQILLRERR